MNINLMFYNLSLFIRGGVRLVKGCSRLDKGQGGEGVAANEGCKNVTEDQAQWTDDMLGQGLPEKNASFWTPPPPSPQR
jgi:hypothetical protein